MQKHRVSDYTARRCCNSFMRLWRKPWRKKSWQFLPFWFNFSSSSVMMQRFSLSGNTYRLLQRYMWWYHHQNQSGEQNMLLNSPIYAKQLSWMLFGIVWEEWEASQIHIRQVLSPSQSCCTAKWLNRKKTINDSNEHVSPLERWPKEFCISEITCNIVFGANSMHFFFHV